MKNPAWPLQSDLAAAKVVRAARTAAGLSQEALAEAAGLHRTYISLLERGRRSPTLVATLDAIGRALGFDYSKLHRLIADALDSAQVQATAASSLTTEGALKPEPLDVAEHVASHRR